MNNRARCQGTPPTFQTPHQTDQRVRTPGNRSPMNYGPRKSFSMPYNTNQFPGSGGYQNRSPQSQTQWRRGYSPNDKSNILNKSPSYDPHRFRRNDSSSKELSFGQPAPASWKRFKSPSFWSPRSNQDRNPGGSSNVQDYYCRSMLDDPWKNMEPVPVSKAITPTT